MTETKKPRGFAAISPERAKEIQSMGGKASPANFKFNKQRASEAGKKGGSNVAKLTK